MNPENLFPAASDTDMRRYVDAAPADVILGGTTEFLFRIFAVMRHVVDIPFRQPPLRKFPQ